MQLMVLIKHTGACEIQCSHEHMGACAGQGSHEARVANV